MDCVEALDGDASAPRISGAYALTAFVPHHCVEGRWRRGARKVAGRGMPGHAEAASAAAHLLEERDDDADADGPEHVALLQLLDDRRRAGNGDGLEDASDLGLDGA